LTKEKRQDKNTVPVVLNTTEEKIFRFGQDLPHYEYTKPEVEVDLHPQGASR